MKSLKIPNLKFQLIGNLALTFLKAKNNSTKWVGTKCHRSVQHAYFQTFGTECYINYLYFLNVEHLPRSNFIGRQSTSTKYLDTEESRTPQNRCTAVRSPYIRGKLTYKTEYEDGSVSDPDDPALLDRYPEYTTDTYLGDRLPTPTQQRELNSKQKASKQKTNLSQYLKS